MTAAFSDLSLSSDTVALLERYGFDRAAFDLLRGRLKRGEATEANNAIKGKVEPPRAGDVVALPPLGSPERKHLENVGTELIRQGLVAAVVLAGGMATRFGGVVKAAVEVARGQTFLDLKLAEIQATAKRTGGKVPVYLMTSFATDADVTRMAQAKTSSAVPVATFPQFISLRMTGEGDIFRDSEGKVSPYAPGHGDLSFAMRRSGVLQKLISQGVTHVYMSNVDNLAATLDPAIIGAHIESGKTISVEVADKANGDKGGAPARWMACCRLWKAFAFRTASIKTASRCSTTTAS